MGVYHGVQLAFAAFVVFAVVRQTRRIVFEGASVDAPALLKALRSARANGEMERFARLAMGASESWVGSLAHAASEAHRDGEDVGGALDEAWIDVRYDASRGFRLLRGLATLASAGGLFGAGGYAWWLLRGDHGLQALMPGRLEAIAFQGAALSVGLGLGSAVFVFLSLRQLHGVTVQELGHCRRAVGVLDGLFGPGDGDDAAESGAESGPLAH